MIFIDLILERCEDKPDDVRKCVEDLVRVGVLNSELNKKEHCFDGGDCCGSDTDIFHCYNECFGKSEHAKLQNIFANCIENCRCAYSSYKRR